jgi:hypothetical protein
MSEHTLSGVDFTNGKRVNQVFNLSDDLLNINKSGTYLSPEGGSSSLFDTTKIVEEITKKSKEKKEKNNTEKEKSNTEKVDTFVEKVEKETPYEILTDAFGGIEKLPTEFKPIKGVDQGFDLIGEPIKRVVPNYKIKGLKENEEVRILPYSNPKDPKYFIVDKRAPGVSSLGGTFASLIDTLTFQKTDLDRLGRKFNVKPKLIDLKDPANYELSKIEKDLVNKELKNKGLIDTVEEDATSGVDKATTKSLEQQKKQTQFDRGQRLRDALQTAGVNFATMPIYTRILEDAARRRLELDKAMLGAREMMPSNIQNIMASKQYQKNLASSAFAEELKAVAAQQDAATKFAGLGMQRAFGQPNPTSFRI